VACLEITVRYQIKIQKEIKVKYNTFRMCVKCFLILRKEYVILLQEALNQ
jgi:hypothetical protein